MSEVNTTTSKKRINTNPDHQRISCNFSIPQLLKANINGVAVAKGFINKNHYLLHLIISDNKATPNSDWLLDMSYLVEKIDNNDDGVKR